VAESDFPKSPGFSGILTKKSASQPSVTNRGRRFLPEKTMTGTNGHAANVEWVRSVLDQYEGALIRYAQRITRDAERARDVVQETFLRLCKQDRADLDGHLAEWLFTVCRNKALDVQRKECRMATVADTEMEFGQSESCCSTPSQIAEQRDSAEHVIGLLGELPGNQQEVIRLKFQNGLSYRAISEITGLSTSNVGYLIHDMKRSRLRLAVKRGSY